jgi:hypothetical protein
MSQHGGKSQKRAINLNQTQVITANGIGTVGMAANKN